MPKSEWIIEKIRRAHDAQEKAVSYESRESMRLNSYPETKVPASTLIGGERYLNRLGGLAVWEAVLVSAGQETNLRELYTKILTGLVIGSDLARIQSFPPVDHPALIQGRMQAIQRVIIDILPYFVIEE